jgi:hypothetical protein
MGDKPFNPKWDAGKTMLLIALEGEGETRSVEVMTPRYVDCHIPLIKTPVRA